MTASNSPAIHSNNNDNSGRRNHDGDASETGDGERSILSGTTFFTATSAGELQPLPTSAATGIISTNSLSDSVPQHYPQQMENVAGRASMEDDVTAATTGSTQRRMEEGVLLRQDSAAGIAVGVPERGSLPLDHNSIARSSNHSRQQNAGSVAGDEVSRSSRNSSHSGNTPQTQTPPQQQHAEEQQQHAEEQTHASSQYYDTSSADPPESARDENDSNDNHSRYTSGRHSHSQNNNSNNNENDSRRTSNTTRDSGGGIRVDREAIFSAPSTELVEATLIRDVDDPSETGHEGDETDHHDDNHYDMDGNGHTIDNVPPDLVSAESTILPPSLARQSTGGMESNVLSELALVEAKPVDTPPQRKAISRKLICVVMALLVVVIVALSVGFAVSAKNKEKKNNNEDNNGKDDNNTTNTINDNGVEENESMSSSSSNSSSDNLSPADASSSQQPQLQDAALMPVLQRLLEQGGPLRCGVIPGPGLFHRDEESGQAIGFDASLCAAIAAAATGDAEYVEYVEGDGVLNTLGFLNDGLVDIVSAGATHTMERQTNVASLGSGFTFTVPYLYQGMQLAGVPSHVECGDQGLEYIAACGDIQVCVVTDSTHQQKLSSYLPGRQMTAVKSRDLLREALANGDCNVIVHEGYNLAEPLIREAGYTGEYLVGKTLFSKEPLAMITSPRDTQFSNFANSVLQSLIRAEAKNITQSTSDQFDQTHAFGEPYVDMFRHAVAVGGNYQELWNRHMEEYLERQTLNLINHENPNATGLLYSHPYGSITGSFGKPGDTLLRVKRRGKLRCGIQARGPGFAELDVNGTFAGIDADFCRAVTASVFAGFVDGVEFIEVNDEQEGFERLAAKDFDLFAGALWNLENDVSVPGVDQGFFFSQPYFFGDSSSNRTGKIGSHVEGQHCLATIEGDHLWSSFVYWITAAVVDAEEVGITQGMSNNMPDVFIFGGDFLLMFQDAILAVGNYQELYERNLGSIIPRSGRNLLNGNVGPQLFAMPGIMD